MPEDTQATPTALERMLRLAAELWMKDHPQEYHLQSYSTSANEFLWAAEAAYFKAARTFG